MSFGIFQSQHNSVVITTQISLWNEADEKTPNSVANFFYWSVDKLK